MPDFTAYIVMTQPAYRPRRLCLSVWGWVREGLIYEKTRRVCG
jgi:hypothetical protein